MIRSIAFSLLSLFIFQGSAQELINLNPDPKGEPWYVGKLRILTEEDYKKIDQTPKLKLPANYQKGSLPTMVDNSLNKYFRPVFNQQNGCCGQASGVGYHFTYAINFSRDIVSNIPQNQYPTHFTYNFLNGGADNGSFYFDGWEIINANGCPNVQTYGGMSISLTTWMNGYSNYFEAMKNRVFDVFTIDVSTPYGLAILKAWLNNQINGSSPGGLANFSGGVSGNFKTSTLPNGTPEQGKSVITFWDSSVNHAMTFVGYNDNICYDFNGDGQYTNNKDIDGNGLLDLRDWEVGGLIMVNSWGLSWGNSGKAYVPYKLLAEPKSNGGIGSSIVHVLKAKDLYTPKATIKATINHTSREKLRITAGISSNPNATKPDYTLQLPIFNFQGGNLYMKGGPNESDKTIEIGLDITPLLSHIDSNQEARIFLVVQEKDQNNLSAGSIISFSAFDYTNGQNETTCPQSNVAISNDDTTYLWVNMAYSFEKVQISTQRLPDAASGFPYKYAFSAQKGTAPYSWNFVVNFEENQKIIPFESISNQMLTPSENDDGFADITLPFSFPFYDKTYNKIKVSTDGSILFGPQFEYVRDLGGLIATKVITVYGTDLMIYPSDGDGIWYKSTNDSLVVRWKTSKFNNSSFNVDFSVTLFPSGLIRFSYGSSISNSTDWIAGLSVGNGVSYNLASISGLNSIPSNYCIEYSSLGLPEGLEIKNNGVMSFIPKEVDKSWPITVKVTDFNKISSTKTFSLHSTNILTFSVDTLKFDSPTYPDPWQDGKDLVITNNYAQSVSINGLKGDGFGWFISNYPLTFPYTLSTGESFTLKVKLKNSFTKSSNTFFDTLMVLTDNITFQLPILINSGIYSTPTFPIIFHITNSLGPLSGATVKLENYTNPIQTNSSGDASIDLVNGRYTYTISFNNHISSSGLLTVDGSAQSINVFLITMNIESINKESTRAYPNPFSHEITVDGLIDTKISIYDLIGRRFVKIESSTAKQRIDTKSLPKGIYILSIEDRNGPISIQKMIKY